MFNLGVLMHAARTNGIMLRLGIVRKQAIEEGRISLHISKAPWSKAPVTFALLSCTTGGQV